MIESISVVGLGKLGSPLCAVLANSGANVVGIDRDRTRVLALGEGRAPVAEPGLATMIEANRTRLSATTEIDAGVTTTDATFIIVPTPSDERGFYSDHFVHEVIEEIGRALRDQTRDHLVIVVDTVMPGTMAARLAPALEAASGRSIGPSLGLCYSPLFVALGDVIGGLCRPDLVLIGESDARAGARLEQIWRRVCGERPAVCRMNWLNAELAKLAINSYLAMKVSFANTFAELAEAMPGADIDVVTDAIGRDKRIGSSFLRGGMPYGGPCLPRDTVALAGLCRSLRLGDRLMEATEAINRQRIDRLHALVVEHLPRPGATVGILGLAFKPGVPVIDASPGIGLAGRLAREGRRVVVHDPMAGDAARAALGTTAWIESDAGSCVRQSDVVVIATSWQEYRGLDAANFRRPNSGLPVIDCWRTLEGTPAGAVARLIRLGVGPTAADAPSSAPGRA